MVISVVGRDAWPDDGDIALTPAPCQRQVGLENGVTVGIRVRLATERSDRPRADNVGLRENRRPGGIRPPVPRPTDQKRRTICRIGMILDEPNHLSPLGRTADSITGASSPNPDE